MLMIASAFTPRETFEIVLLWYQSLRAMSIACKSDYFSLCWDETFASCSFFSSTNNYNPCFLVPQYGPICRRVFNVRLRGRYLCSNPLRIHFAKIRSLMLRYLLIQKYLHVHKYISICMNAREDSNFRDWSSFAVSSQRRRSSRFVNEVEWEIEWRGKE